MQPQNKSSTNVFIALGVVAALIIAGYFYFTRDRSSDAVLTSDSISGVQNDLVVILQKLQTVSLDGSILASISEITLHDIGHPLVAETAGRNNPFAPLLLESLTPLKKTTEPLVPVAKKVSAKK